MKNVLKNFLENGTYNFDDAQERIDYAVAKGKIKAKDAEEFLRTAKKKASSKTIAERVEDMEKTMKEKSIDSDKLSLFLASIAEDEKPAEKEGFNLIQRYDHSSHRIVWEYVPIAIEP